MKIGILGFGRFGQFLGETISKNHNVIAYSRSNYSDIAKTMKIDFYQSLPDFLHQKLDIIILSVSIISFEKVISSLQPYLQLLQDVLLVDVLSVKNYPKKIILNHLDLDKYNIDYLATHPMFGPDSGWIDRPMVYNRVRISNSNRVVNFLDIFKEQQCIMTPLTCDEHDKYSAKSQFITHLTGRILGNLDLEDTPINTNGYNSLLTLVDNTCNDSLDLFQGLYQYNDETKLWLTKFRQSLDLIENKLHFLEKSFNKKVNQ